MMSNDPNPIGSGTDLLEDARRWVFSAPLVELVRAFGGVPEVIYAGDDIELWLQRLDEFSDRWDSRKGEERNLAGSLELTDEQQEVVGRASRALGLTSTSLPTAESYDHVFLLGGLVRACLTRPAYAAALVRNGGLRTKAVTALGGHRPFRGDEFELAQTAGHPALDNEFDALDVGTRAAFRLGEATFREQHGEGNSASTINSYEGPDDITVRVAAAPSGDPEHRRANTADTYAWFAEHVAVLPSGSRVLAVTTAIYVPAQHAAAVRMLTVPYGLKVETVGMMPGDVIPALAQTFSPSQYLQEVRSAIRNVRDLVGTLAA